MKLQIINLDSYLNLYQAWYVLQSNLCDFRGHLCCVTITNNFYLKVSSFGYPFSINFSVSDT